MTVTSAQAIADPREYLGKDIFYNVKNDLQVNSKNDLQAVNFYDNLSQAISNRLKTEIGELSLHPLYGSRLPELLGTNADELTLTTAKMHVREALLQEPRIQSIVSITPSFRPQTNRQVLDIAIVVKPIKQLTNLNLIYSLFI